MTFSFIFYLIHKLHFTYFVAIIIILGIDTLHVTDYM